MKKLNAVILFILLFQFASAQQIGMYSHYFFKPMVYNPAFTGTDEGTNAMIVSRAQWTDFKGAPQLNLFTLDGNLMNKKVGLGLSLISDRKGLTNRMGGNINYSYRLNINDDMHLTFGVSAGIIDQTIDYSKALVENISDPVIFYDSQRKTTFDANAGLAFFWKGLEFGAAVPQILGNKINYVDNTNVRASYTQARHYLGTLKYKFFLSKEKGISISPMALVRFIPNTPFQYDGNLNFDWKDKFWIGATYKSDYAVGANAGFCIHKQLYVGYAYDFIIGSISKYAGTSHEIMINFRFGKNKKNDPEAVAETNPATEKQPVKNEAYEKRLDSLQDVVQEDQDQIRENKRKIKELSDKLDQQAKVQQTMAAQNQGQQQNQSPVSNSNPNQNPAQGTGNNSTPVQNTGNTAPPNNENQNVSAVETNPNKVLDSGVWLVTGKAKECKDVKERTPQQGFYVVAGTFVYKDFAEAEVKRLISKGYSGTSLLYFEPKQFNYVFIAKPATKEEAIKKVQDVRAGGIKDAWILQLTE